MQAQSPKPAAKSSTRAPRRPRRDSAIAEPDDSQTLSFLSAFGAVLVAPAAALAAATHRSMISGGAPMFDAADRYALLLSLIAGLATTVGGLIAVWRKPDQKLLAFLLGTAVGVMATLSVVELYVKNVLENGFVGITLATACGAMVYVVVEPLLPKAEVLEARGGLADAVGTAGPGGRTATDGDPESTVEIFDKSSKMSKARLMRLGLLMAITMTLHNLPEGFAVAFSSYTSVGPVMAAAIGVHNVPEGIIVAAPVFAATGSRKRALLMATVSGLSEPAGALLALCFIKPYLTPLLLQYLLASTGGMMSAVCLIELLPEGRKCRENGALARGVLVGTAVMLGTLYVGV